VSSLTTIRQGEDWVGDPPSQPSRGLIRRWDSTSQQWVPVVPKSYDGFGWSTPPEYDYTWARRSAFSPTYLGEGTVWKRDVVGSAMPLATKSADFAAWMDANLHYGSGFGPTSLNTSVAGTHPIQCYVVDSRIPGTNYQYISPSSLVASYLSTLIYGWVPWPNWAFIPQGGQDSALAIFDLGTGILREYYLVSRVAGTENRWTCVTGGYSVAPRDLEDWGDWNYPTQLTEGSSAVVGMHNHLGWIDIAGCRRDSIDHAIAFTCANMNVPTSSGEAIRPDGTRYTSVGPSWPAKGGDGDTVSADAPIHGQWARLPMSLDLSSSGPYPPFVRLVIEAIQQYGMVCTDSNNFVHAFNAEPGFEEQFWLGVDPWSTNGDLFQKFAALNAAEGRDATAPFSMASFPWALTEWAPRNWGKP
jgi:hypothetical protein